MNRNGVRLKSECCPTEIGISVRQPSEYAIAPLTDAYENKETSFFAVGRSGCDGIDFGYRAGHVGLWAYYPITREFKFMSTTVVELVEGWCSGKLSV
jgi:hypothetical protein